MPTSVTVSSGQTSSGLTISAGETLYVLSGGTVSGIIVSGGYEHVYAGGLDSAATVESGGTLDVYGSARNDLILSGGAAGAGSGGLMFGTSVGSGGVQNVFDAGEIENTVVSGGTQNASGGEDYNVIADSGGTINVMSGGVTFGKAENGGTFNILSGGAIRAISTLVVYIGGTVNLARSIPTNGVDRDGGTLNILCFASGTQIETERGFVAVEDLAVGELVKAHFAASAPIIWIGKRTIDCRRHARPEGVYPVRVRAGAFGEGVPFRDVFLSPDHAVFAADVLVPVRELINATSIAQVPVDSVEYFHVELRHHDVLFAEGLPAESYLDTGNRANFAGQPGVIALHPEFAARVWDADGCAPLVIAGRELEAVKRLVVDAGEVGPGCIEDRRRAASH
jgi:autotransporter passenger strand-loop-strand repeat protein